MTSKEQLPATTFAGGEQVSINSGWESRFAEWSTEDFAVCIDYNSEGLTNEEQHRLLLKLDIVADYAAKLALAMTKGTLKYPTDTRTPEQWQAFADDEFNDIVNYRLLTDAAKRDPRFNKDLPEAVDNWEAAP